MLDKLVFYGRYAQRAFLAIGFRDIHPLDQFGREATGIVFFGSSSHTFESARHRVLALCPSDGFLSGVPLVCSGLSSTSSATSGFAASLQRIWRHRVRRMDFVLSALTSIFSLVTAWCDSCRLFLIGCLSKQKRSNGKLERSL